MDVAKKTYNGSSIVVEPLVLNSNFNAGNSGTGKVENNKESMSETVAKSLIDKYKKQS